MKKKYFTEKYKISDSKFRKAKISWKDLLCIYSEFSSKQDKYLQIAEFLSNSLAKVPNVHSTRFRVKNPEHLIEKIIRKNVENSNKIAKSNYTTEITDLVGVRALHLYKKDWREIDFFIKRNWDLLEKPKAYFREGDDKEILNMYEENDCENHEHPFGYRSIHYLIKVEISKEIQSICEIQVRTIFEEGWSEIDHKVRYPYMSDDKILAGYLGLLNKICGSADDMATFIDAFLEKYKLIQEENMNNALKIGELEKKINELSIESEDKGKLISELKSLESNSASAFTLNQYYRTCRKCGKLLTGLHFGEDDDLCDSCKNLENLWTIKPSTSSDIFSDSTKRICSICRNEYEPAISLLDDGICPKCKLFKK